MQDFEKLGVFYLGKEYDRNTNALSDDLLLYNAKDLTTHAVIIGMTGSGKTGLGIGMLEEAALDHIPVIAIDPKGDLANLLLTFPDLDAASFLPWLPPPEPGAPAELPAQRAEALAATWRKGLADWGQDGARIARLRAAVDLAIYTPGSSAGTPISVLRSFNAPSPALHDDADLYRERVQAVTQGVLTLIGIDADPLTSREHVLIANLLDQAWQQGTSLNIADLIRGIQQPPFQQIGVLDLESFYPRKERAALAMQLNNLLAAPGFAAWMQGEPLDASGLLFSPSGKPKISVISIAHLGDRERMFFVSTLLSELVSWMRTQPGTGSLRAILYMDEIAGYLPPTANPPSKPLFLTLLKQARAFGLGLVLATQNPVDLDYKALSNAGTWFIGRLQTEQDKARVMDGLQGASGGSFDRASLERILSGLGKRIFLMHSVHENQPTIFTTRWCLSYLAGPMTREQIKRLKLTTDGGRQTKDEGRRTKDEGRTLASAAPKKPAPAPAPIANRQSSIVNPVLPPQIVQHYLPARRRGAVEYRACVIAAADVSYTSAKYGVQKSLRLMLLCPINDSLVAVEWAKSHELSLGPDDLESVGAEGARYATLPSAASDAKRYTEWGKLFERYVRTEKPLLLYRSSTLKVTSQPGEGEREFRIRLAQLARESRDEQVTALRERFLPKVEALEERLARAEEIVRREQAEANKKKLGSAMQIGGALLGGLFGRRSKTSISKAARGISAMRGGDAGLQRAEDNVDELRSKLADLQTEAQQAVTALERSFDNQAEALEQLPITAKSSDIQTHFVGLAWAPYLNGQAGW